MYGATMTRGDNDNEKYGIKILNIFYYYKILFS